jgi:hypothetical protein
LILFYNESVELIARIGGNAPTSLSAWVGIIGH